VAVLGVVEADGFVEVVASQGVFLQGVVRVGSQIVDPEFSSPGFFAAGFLVEEEDIGLHSGRVPDAGREPEEGVHFALPEEPSSDCLTGASFEEDVVR
jgi:hypothetical protein